jgi:hypothetical protein
LVIAISVGFCTCRRGRQLKTRIQQQYKKKPSKSVKLAGPHRNTENIEKLIDVLALVEEWTEEKKRQREAGTSPPHNINKKPTIPTELLQQLEGLDQLTSGKTDGSPEDVVKQLDVVARMLTEQQADLNISPEALAVLRGALVDLVDMVKGQDRMEEHEK